jgi:lactate dehydrogenase-like 2-hydroxyacid dehydrogenase
LSKPEILTVAKLWPPYLEELQQTYVVHDRTHELDAAAFAQIAPRIKAIAGGGESQVTRALMAQLPALEMISVFGVGYDRYDMAAARERSIPITNTPDVLTDDVADMGISLMLAVARTIPQADKYVREGKWPSGPMPLARKVTGARLGIVGLGRIGSAIARRAAGFDMSIAYTSRNKVADSPYTYYPTPAALAAEVDFLMVITPGGAGTKGLINTEVLKALGPKGYLINVARGSVVDETALIAALQNNVIAGAALDVFENEPHVPAALCAMSHVVLAPHVASATWQTRRAMADLAFGNLQAHFAGQPFLKRLDIS